MKRIKDGRKVITGQVSTGTYENRIHLSDGKFTTGYRIVSFQISPVGPQNKYELICKLSTEPKSTLGQWHWQDVQELAWAAWGIPEKDRYGIYSQIRDENMVIEDLWLNAYATTEATTINYEIILEKYEFPAWDGAGVIVQNQRLQRGNT